VVFLALDPSAAVEAIELERLSGAAVWVGSDAMSREEHHRNAAEGLKMRLPLCENTIQVRHFGCSVRRSSNFRWSGRAASSSLVSEGIDGSG
jgi:hypothetical protein